MVADRESVRFVADSLQQIEPFAGARHDHRLRIVWLPDFFQSLGETDQGNVVEIEFGERPPRGGDLRRPAVHDDEVRRVREFAWLAGGRVDVARDLAPFVVRLIHLQFALGSLVEITAKPPADHLVDGRDVVGRRSIAVRNGHPDGVDSEPAVFALARQPVFEHHHRGDDVGALQVRDVVALDAQRRLLQFEGVLDLLQRAAASRQIASPLHFVQRQSLDGVARDGLHECALVATLRNAQVDATPASSA